MTRHALEALSDAVLHIAAHRSVDSVLQELVEAARDLVDATYAAVGVPDDEGGFGLFLTSGISDAQIEAIGPLPRTHGMLAAVLEGTETLRTGDLQSDPRFEGWPAAHPDMRSLLGVPIVSKGETIGAFYLTDKRGASGFTEGDQDLIERFAAHAAVALENAHLIERSRELSVVEERNRLALELHDSVTHSLFSLTMLLEAATRLVESQPDRAKAELERTQLLAQAALAQLRSLVFELRPADLSSDGLVQTLRKHVDIVRRVHGANVELDVGGERRLDAPMELAIFRIVQEALNNALKHAGEGRIVVGIDMTNGLVRATVADSGKGFEPKDPGIRSRRLGLTSMEERASEIGGTLRIDSAPGRGTEVSLEVRA